MYETKNIKTQAQRKKETQIIHIGKTIPNRMISCETQQYARSIAGEHNSLNSQKRATKIKGKSLKKASRKACKIMLAKEKW